MKIKKISLCFLCVICLLMMGIIVAECVDQNDPGDQTSVDSTTQYAETSTVIDIQPGIEAQTTDDQSTQTQVNSDPDTSSLKKFFDDNLLLIILLVLAIVLVVAIFECIVIVKGKNMLGTRSGKNQISSTETLSFRPGSDQMKSKIRSVRIGKVHGQGARSNQEDCFSVSVPEHLKDNGILAVVADGMGGLDDGEQVSYAAVNAVMENFPSMYGDAKHILINLTASAKIAVNQFLTSDRIQHCGSTMIIGLVKDGYFNCISVGDSRICLFRNGGLIQLNRNHTLLPDLLVDNINGKITLEEIYSQPKLGGLTSYIGMGDLEHVDIPVTPIRICRGDKFILMSDGVFNALTESELTMALVHNAQKAADTVQTLIESKALPNQDNFTAIIIECC